MGKKPLVHHIVRDVKKHRELWEKFWPQKCLFDLWPVRYCFYEPYAHLAEFYVFQENGNIVGLLPLSWIEESQHYCFFPGELCKGKTWLEQNRIISQKPFVTKALLESVGKPVHLRYLLSEYVTGFSSDDENFKCSLDETGYLFFPAQHEFSFDKYLQEFSKKTRKKLAKKLPLLERRGVTLRFDHFRDINKLFQMNISHYKERSYFDDKRFLRSFIRLAEWLKKNRMLCITTLLIGGCVAAVDMGAIWNSQYTVLAGGTSLEFPEAAKLINFHHIKWACHKRFSLVDFLCGDFGWKHRFHLTPRPLYLLHSLPNPVST